MSDLIITPSSGKIDFIYQSGQEGQTSRLESIIIDPIDGLVFSGKISASSVNSPLNITATSSNINYPFIFASSGETGAKSLLMDSAGGTYNPSTNLATVNISGTSSWATNAVTNANLTGDVTSVGNETTIANSVVTNAKLANSSVTIGSTAISLGADGAQTTIVGLVSVTSTTFVGDLTGTATTASYANALNAANRYTVVGITGSLFGTSSWASNAVTSLACTGNAATVTNGLYTNSTLTAGNLSGTIPSAVLGNSTVYIGSTAVPLNRANTAIVLTGITSIDGNAATATTASYANNLNAANQYTVVGITGSLFGTSSWATNATNALTATNATQLNGQADSYYTNIPARLGYTPVDKAGDTVTGNLIINGNFSVNGSFTAFSASNVYISSSQLYIEDNILTLNAFSPYLRYAGVEMYDSGSGTLSSLLWDGEADYFFLSGSSVNGKIITGPDSQANLSANFVPKATAGYKLGNSVIYDDGTNIGIGLTTPDLRLHIEAANAYPATSGTTPTGFLTLRAKTAGGTHGMYMGVANASPYGSWIQCSDSTNLAANYPLLLNPNGGNVGIGINSPSGVLDIQSSNAGDQLVRAWNTNTTGTGKAILRVANSGNNAQGTQLQFSDLNYYVGTIASDRTNGMAFYVGQQATPLVSERMRIDISGNIGIGTVAPVAKLHINSTTAGATLLRTDGTNGTLFSVVDDLSDSLMSVNNSAGLPVLEVFADDRIVMGQYGQNDFVLVNNKVGIGTNNPSFKLDITGSLGINASSLDTNWPFVVSDNSSAGSRYGLNKAGSMGFNNADNYAQLQLVGTNGAYLDLTNSVGGDSNARLIYYAGSRLDLTYGFTTTLTLNSTNAGIGTTSPRSGFQLNTINGSSGNEYAGLTVSATVSASRGVNIAYDATNDIGVIQSVHNGVTWKGLSLSPQGGLVGIATSVPTTPLHVVGVISGSSFSGAGTGLTGTAAGLSIGGTAATVTTNANLTGHITSTGNATLLGSFTSAQLLAALTDETGTGASVFANSPTLVTPALGTPSSGVLTNCTGTAAGLSIGGTAATASYANALNAANSYTVVDVNTTGNIRLRNGDPTITLSDTNHSSSFIHVDGNYFSILCGPPNASFGEWVVPANGRWPMEISLTNNTSTFGGSLDAISFTGAGTGLTGTAANLSIGGTAATASYANALNAANNYTVTGITGNLTGNVTGTATTASYANALNAANSYTVTGITGALTGTATTASYANALNAANNYTVAGITGNLTGTSSWASNAVTSLACTGNAGTVTNGVYTTGNQSIAGTKTFTGVTSFSNTSDYQIVLDGSGGTWAGINWSDVNGADVMWFNGQNETFAIGGGGSNVSGKKLHVHGGVTIGSDYHATVVPSNGLSIQGGVQIGNYSTYVINALGASGTQSRTFEIARLGIDYNDWNNIGTFEVEIHEKYYSQGLKKVYNIWYGYPSNSGIRLVELRGTGDNNFQCRIGSQVQISGDSYYLPVYVDIKYYSSVDVVIKTNRNITTTTNPEIGYTYINIAPTPTNISSFTADSDLEISTLASAKLGGNTILTTATTSATGLSIGGTAATASYANALNAANSYTVTNLTASGVGKFFGNIAIITDASAGDYSLIGHSYGGATKAFTGYNDGSAIYGGESTIPTRIQAGGQYAISVLANGLVGIGTTVPASLLHVYSTSAEPAIRLTSTSGSAKTYGLVCNTAWAPGSFHIYDYTADATRIYISSGGNVGIGVGATSPAAKLYVVSSDGPIARFDGSSVATSGATEIDILGPQSNGDLNLGIGGSTFTDATNNIQNKAFVTAGTGLSGLNLRSDAGYVQITAGGNASSYEVARFTSAGNVGIGTTVPVSKLHINSTTSGATLLRTDGTNGTLFSVVDDLSDSLMSVNNSAGLPVLEVFADDRIVAGQYGQNDFVVVNNKVGIGTNNPLAKLHVTGSSSVPAAVLMGNVGIGTTSFVYSNANRGLLEIYGSSDALISLRNATANSYLQKTGNDFYFNNGGAGFIAISTNGSERMFIKSDGNVGIGTSVPTARVDTLGVRIGRDFSIANRATVRLDSNDTSYPSDVLFGHTVAANQDSWNGVYWSLSSRAAADGNKFYFYRGSGNPAPNNSEAIIMTFDPNLNVGIGITSPTTKLHVVGVISGSSFTGAGTGLTGTAASLTAGTATNATQLGGVSAASYVTLNDTQSLTNKTITGTFTGALTGNASTSTIVNGTNGQLLAKDIRAIAPNNIAAGYLQFGFTTWTNTLSTTPYADYLHLRSYADSSGGNDNLIMFNKSVIGMRIWQQTFGSATNYSSYKDVCWTDGTNASGTWAITSSWATNAVTSLACTGNAATVTNGVYTTGAQSVGGVKSFTSTMNVTGVRETMTTVAAATNVAINLNLGTIFKLTFSSTVSTFTITNTENTNVAAGNSFTLISAPDNSNAKTIAFSFITNGAAATAVKWATFAGGTTPTATITNGKFDVFSFVYDGVNWYGFTGGLTY